MLPVRHDDDDDLPVKNIIIDFLFCFEKLNVKIYNQIPKSSNLPADNAHMCFWAVEPILLQFWFEFKIFLLSDRLPYQG